MKKVVLPLVMLVMGLAVGYVSCKQQSNTSSSTKQKNNEISNVDS